MRTFFASAPAACSRALAASLVLAAAAIAQQATLDPPPAAEAAAPTELALASIFSDHMVLQRDMEIPLWGTAEPGAEVSVKFGDETKRATADDEGHWKLKLTSHVAGGPHELTITDGDQSKTYADVLVGDVWVASGQSNMEWPVGAANNADAEIRDANFPKIRIMGTRHETADEPLDAIERDAWAPVTPQTIGGFSAVAYFFGRDLHEHLDVPIGLIGCNWGGTPMEAWASREALAASDTFAPVIKAADAEPANEQEAEARRAGPQNIPARLFNGMLSSVIPYGIRGAIWYQGESNAGRHQQYAELSKLMIADWRSRWGQGDFPFLLVQLAGWQPGGESWPFLREAQSDTLESLNVGMATAIDIGDEKDIHPRNKQEVGRRLALVARHVAYGEDLIYSGPVFNAVKIEGDKAVVAFDQTGNELRIKDGDELKGFEIAGADGKFVAAKAVIDGKTVVVSGDDIASPTQVRYDWAPYPDGNLINAEGLPALPFRSDR